MSGLQADAKPYRMLTGADGDLQLVALDAEADWIVVEQVGTQKPRIVPQQSADGDQAYFQGLLGHPAWVMDRGLGRVVHVFAAGRSEPLVIGSTLRHDGPPPD